jgi:hypothetical protein
MENPEITILQSHVMALQNTVGQLWAMLQSNFPNGGFGGDVSNMFGGINMSTLMLMGKGPKAYERWLQDQTFEPEPYEDYPGKSELSYHEAVNWNMREIKNHLADRFPFGKSDRPKLMEVGDLRFYNLGDLTNGGVYRYREGNSSYKPEGRGVVLNVGGRRHPAQNRTKVFFPIDDTARSKVFVYVPIEDTWVVGDWEHVNTREMDIAVEAFLDGKEPYETKLRMPSIPAKTVVELFDDLDMTFLYGEISPTGRLEIAEDTSLGPIAKWQYQLLDPLSYVKDHSLPHHRYISWRSGQWYAHIGLDIEEPTVHVYKHVGGYNGGTSKWDWDEQDTAQQWALYDQIRRDLVKRIQSREDRSAPHCDLLGVQD